MLEVTFCSEGREVQAHRVVLAAVSQKWIAQWSGQLTIEDMIYYDCQDDPDTVISHLPLSFMIDFAYGSEVDWNKVEISVDNDSQNSRGHGVKVRPPAWLLGLHSAAKFWLMPALMSEVEKMLISAYRWTIFLSFERVAIGIGEGETGY